MSKDSILFGIIGLLLGTIIGFVAANRVNQSGFDPTRAASANSGAQNGALPSDHPPVDANNQTGQPQGPATGAPPPEVMARIQKAKDEPTNVEAQVDASDLYIQIGRFDQAIALLENAHKLKADSGDIVVRLANANFDAKHYEAAGKWYEDALSKNPADVNVRTDLGLTYYLRTPPDLDRALREYRASLAKDPKHELTLQNLIVALIDKKEAKEAQAMLARLEQVNPQNTSLPRLRTQLQQLTGG